MDIGLQLIFSSYGWQDGMSDGQVYGEELRLARLAEELGFDAIGPVEHHFFDYSFCPDNTQFLAYRPAVLKKSDWVQPRLFCRGTIPYGWPRRFLCLII